MNFKTFNSGIKNIINLLSYDFYVIEADNNLKCSCIDIPSKQPNPNCKKCLGLGHKIKIKKVKGYSNDDQTTIRSNQNIENVLSTVYYIDNNFNLKNEQIIVDDKEIYVINRIERFKSSNKNILYKQYFCMPKKNFPSLFLKNFYNIVS